MMDSLGISDRSFEFLDLDLFPSVPDVQQGTFDLFEDGSKDSLSEILPEILGHGFDHLSTLPLDEDLDFNCELPDLERDAVLQEFVHEMQNTLPSSHRKKCLKGILGRDFPQKLPNDSTAFLDGSKVWTYQLNPLAVPLLESDENMGIPKEETESTTAVQSETLNTYSGQITFATKTRGSVHVVEKYSDVEVDSGDDVDIETVDDGEMKGKSCAEILSAKLASLANECKTIGSCRIKRPDVCKLSIPSEKLVSKEATGYKKSKSKKVMPVKPQVNSSISKSKCKLKDCNPSTVIEKIKQSSANRRGSILISHEDVLLKCKTSKNASLLKPKTVKTSIDDNCATIGSQPAADHDYCSDVIIIERTSDLDNNGSVEIVTTDINCSNEDVWLEPDNCMVVEEVVENCDTIVIQDEILDSVPTLEFQQRTDNIEESVASSKNDNSATVFLENDASDGSIVEKENKDHRQKASGTRAQSVSKRRKRMSRWRRKRYRSSCSPSNSSSSPSIYRSRSRSPSRSRRRRRSSRYSQSSSKSSSRSRSRSWSRKQDYPRFKRKERRSPSPLYQNNLSQNRSQDEKMNQIDKRRVIFVGKIPDGATKTLLRQRFGKFGPIQEVSVHFRDNGDNYGFVTFVYSCDAYEALEHGNDNVNEPKFDLCFGGRRQFCRRKYADLDAQFNNFAAVKPNPRSSNEMDFDSLLNAAKSQLRKGWH